MLIANGDRLLFTGDSVTDAGRGVPVGEGLWAGVGNGYVRCIDSLLSVFYTEKLIRVMNTGNSGNTVLDLEKRWQNDVLNLNPDWLSICIGVNDVWRQFDSPCQTELHVYPEVYKKTLEKLVDKTLPNLKGLIMMTPYYMEPIKTDPMRAKMDEYGLIVKEIANKNGAVFVDLQEVFDEFFAYRHSSFVAWDRIHPNNTGCMLIATAFLKAVGFNFNK